MKREATTAAPTPRGGRARSATRPTRRRLASHPLLAWLTLLAIAGTLCACGRYGPPKRRTTAAPVAGTASDSAVPPSPTSEDGERRDERDE